jgi:hypothetical protein
MRLRRLFLPAFSLCLLAASPGAPAPAAGSSDASAGRVLGDWHGSLLVGGTPLRLAVHFVRRADGILMGTLDNPDQGAMGLAMDSVAVAGDTLRFTMSTIHGSYVGALAADTLVSGTWTQGSAALPLDWIRGALPVRSRAQDPTKPYPYDEGEVVVENRAAGARLAGTLTRPRGTGPFPAALLITGSGPQNRDEELLGHRPFLVLADHLTRHGVAVLRLDDRGVGKSTGNFGTATTPDFASDARAAVDYLAARPDVDRTRIGLIGHSEGAVVAPMVAAGAKDIAFVVLLAGPGVPGDSLLYLQGAAVMRAMGEREDMILWNRRLQELMFAEVKTAPDSAALRQRLIKVIVAATQQLDPSRRGQVNDQVLGGQVAMMTSPWFRFFVGYDPGPALRRLTCPVLAITGSLDLQVTPKENLSAITDALTAGGNRDHDVRELPLLNHLFQTSTTGSPAEYGTIEETFAPAALDTISTWIGTRVAGKAGGK